MDISWLQYNAAVDAVISVDTAGIIEYWSGIAGGYSRDLKGLKFTSKLDTDLYEFVKVRFQCLW